MTGALSNTGAVKMRSREAKRQLKKRTPRTAASLLRCLTRWPPPAWAPPPYPPKSPHNSSRCATVCLSVHPRVCLSVCMSICQPPYDLVCSLSLCVHHSAEWSLPELRSHPAPKLLMLRAPQAPKSEIFWLAHCFQLIFAFLNAMPLFSFQPFTVLPLQVLMEAALALTRGVPRAYLLPSPQQRQADAQLTFRPQITQKSKVSFQDWAARTQVLSLCLLQDKARMSTGPKGCYCKAWKISLNRWVQTAVKGREIFFCAS